MIKDYKMGFGGQNGVQNDRMDVSALDWQFYEEPQKHHSQIGNRFEWLLTS